MAKRKFLFLYLNTGAGHISAAKVLAEAMRIQNPDAEIKMLNGFPKHKAGHLLFEKGYNYACNYVHGAFPLIYDLAMNRWAQDLVRRILAPESCLFILRSLRLSVKCAKTFRGKST